MSFTMEKYIQEGYTKVIRRTGKPFIMKWWAADYIFLPPKYLVDLKRADAHDLSFFENISNAFSLYASVGDLYSSDLMIDVVKRGINPRLPKLIPLLIDECDYAFGKEIGAPVEWTPFPAAALFAKIMHRTTSKILIGSELCRNDLYLRTSMAATDSIFVNGLVMTMLPLGWFRRPLCHLLSVFHRRRVREAVAAIMPIVEARFREFQSRGPETDKSTSGPLDAIEWSLQYSEGDSKEHNPDRIALSLVHNLWAGSAAPGALVTSMVFEVLLQPQYLGLLRAESEAAVAMHGFTDKTFSNMPLMDSFIRELNRVYPVGAVTCARTVMSPGGFRFHDGFELPQGAKVAIPALAIQTSLDNFQDPLTVDISRFAKLRPAAGPNDGDEGDKWGASTISETNLAFGFGRHACPGRFYAVRKAKMIFSKLIMEYDIKWEGTKSRPPSLSVNGQFAPNQSQKIFLRKRNMSE
ncbi:cytochrome P450 [Thozetella sp. PMI_491]|nr:cytochrome P450 [Thozetella sp. PMI_491]